MARKPSPFRIVSTTHDPAECAPCYRAVHAAKAHASVTGSIGATWREVSDGQVQHAAEVTRLSAAELARRESDATGDRLIEALSSTLPVIGSDVAKRLDKLIQTLRAQEYEAGWLAAGGAPEAIPARSS